MHGITDDDVAGLPKFDDVRFYLNKVLSTKTVVIYNAAYDLRLITQSMRHNSVDMFLFNCAMKRYSEFVGDWNDYHGNYRWHKLSRAAARFGADTTGAHGAVADCLMTLAVLRGMAESELNDE